MERPVGVTDRDVVVAVLDGDIDQFALLVHRYRRPLLHVASSRLGRLDVAEDAVQETFVCAYKSLHTYKPQYSFRTWLWTILLNQCRRHAQRLARQVGGGDAEMVADQLGDRASPPAVLPELQAMTSERNELLQRLLTRLPENQADAVRLRFFGQLKYREIAEAMQCSLGAAKKRVRQGLTAMSELLRRAGLVDSVFPGEDR